MLPGSGLAGWDVAGGGANWTDRAAGRQCQGKPRLSCPTAWLAPGNARFSTAGMKVDCLMGTYGRYGLICEALACFLQQTRLGDATLLIQNQHPIPLRLDHPRVRIVNEKMPNGLLFSYDAWQADADYPRQLFEFLGESYDVALVRRVKAPRHSY